jgi:outer membrane protein OmpA-like peptidoglycan-associated protein
LATIGIERATSFPRSFFSQQDLTMSIKQKFLAGAFTVAILSGGMVLAMAPAGAEELSAQQIIDGLKVSHSRSLSAPGSAALNPDDQAFVKRVRGLTRSLSSEDRDRMADIATKRPGVDIDVNFDYNSASLTPRVEPQLKNLGVALTSPELAGSVVFLGGHTDAKGPDSYNQSLSERRAEAMKRYLMENYHVPAANLVVAGYGKKGLKNTADPYAAENRRVQVSNVAAGDEASR